MELKLGLSSYRTILIEEWTTDDTDKNIGTQILKFVKESLENFNVSEIKLVFVGDDRNKESNGIVGNVMVFPDDTAILMVSIVIKKDKEQIKTTADVIIDKLHELEKEGDNKDE